MFKTFQLSKQKGIKYTEYQSKNPDIQYFWKLETDIGKNGLVDYKIIPDGSIDIVFEEVEGKLFNPSVSAPFRKITSIVLPQNSIFVGIRFNPGKFRKYIDIDCHNIEEDFLDIKRREYRSVDDFLSSLKCNLHNPLAKYDDSLTKLLNSSLSQKQKRRIFKNVTGFNIREFKKIINFQSSLTNAFEGNYYD